jgi:7-cyano-7-deazaguanine synthase
LNFDEVYSRTNTSYKPLQYMVETYMVETIPDQTELKWFSDYKSASSVERVEAFIKLGRPDPVEYADETGPVTWEHVVEEVSKVLASHND